MPALYRYAGRNWFRHCRSYQDIALSQHPQHPNHSLDIPILNTFLGSFHLASVCFSEWVTWVEVNSVYEGGENLHGLVLSTPLRPAFAAAVCGLGELVSWLWHSEGADMNIKNDYNYSLLYLASRYGTTWIMSCVIARGADLDINEVCNSVTALSGAAESGGLEHAALLLDQGADINLTFHGFLVGSALEVAAIGGKLEMATLFLDRGADINLISSKFFGTAISLAAFFECLEMATLLLDRGANPDSTNYSGKKPRDLAERTGHHQMVTLFAPYSARKSENQENHTQTLVMDQ